MIHLKSSGKTNEQEEYYINMKKEHICSKYKAF